MDILEHQPVNKLCVQAGKSLMETKWFSVAAGYFRGPCLLNQMCQRQWLTNGIRRRFWTKMIYYMPLQTLYKILKIRGIKMCFIKIVKRHENCVELKGVYFKKKK